MKSSWCWCDMFLIIITECIPPLSFSFTGWETNRTGADTQQTFCKDMFEKDNTSWEPPWCWGYTCTRVCVLIIGFCACVDDSDTLAFVSVKYNMCLQKMTSPCSKCSTTSSHLTQWQCRIHLTLNLNRPTRLLVSDSFINLLLSANQMPLPSLLFRPLDDSRLPDGFL